MKKIYLPPLITILQLDSTDCLTGSSEWGGPDQSNNPSGSAVPFTPGWWDATPVPPVTPTPAPESDI
ncbi:MAG: hypothetical protein Q4C04_01835 [Clostridia bacterium]|nr:hypothetical protein [Clostridia bacterium]